MVYVDVGLFYKYSIELKKIIYKKSYENDHHRPAPPNFKRLMGV